MTTLFVVGRDWKFRALLRAQLREEGYHAVAFESLAEAEEELGVTAPTPAALLFDTTDAPSEEMERVRALASRLPVVVLASAQEDVGSGAATLLRRPVQVADLVAAIKKLVGPGS